MAKKPEPKKSKKKESTATGKYQPEKHVCPFCDKAIAEAMFPYCQACEVVFCPKCQKAVSPDSKICPHCGADIRREATKEG